jgi:MoaA/NifB/PqqE/SkfB family radical SAM enzyme
MHADTLKFYKYVPVEKPLYKGKFCDSPFVSLQIDHDGDVQLCGCQYHMPYTIGNIYQNSLQDIWLGPAADDVRQSVLDETFTYCSWNCSALPNLPDRSSVIVPELCDFPEIIKIDLDRSCNLKCASCREGIIIEKNSLRIDKQTAIFTEIIQWALSNPHRNICVHPISSGEIFASHSGMAFLKLLVDYPHDNLKLIIATNGTLITRHKELLLNLKPLLKRFTISVDAATAETYAVVRGGVWQDVVDGIAFISQTLRIKSNLRFCIQKNNWHEIELFAKFADQYQVGFEYQKLLDWGHWTIAWWHDNNVFDRTRPTFVQALEKLKLIKQTYPGQVSMAAELTKYIQKS